MRVRRKKKRARKRGRERGKECEKKKEYEREECENGNLYFCELTEIEVV